MTYGWNGQLLAAMTSGNCLAVVCKAGTEIGPAHMSLFSVGKDDSHSVSKMFDVLTHRRIDACEVISDCVRVPVRQLIGGAKGEGFEQTFVGSKVGWISVAPRGVGAADSAYFAELMRTAASAPERASPLRNINDPR
ncbi:acyl-CoA/acyl-ACP dehydrogenase [Jatrophihabitans sp. DSM 45814]